MEKIENTVYAGFWLRFVAVIIDSFIIGFLQAFIVIPFFFIYGLGFALPMGFAAFDNPDFDWGYHTMDNLPMFLTGIFILAMVTGLIKILYYSILESSRHQATLGKIALGLRVTDMDGNRLDFIKAFLRNLGKILSGMMMNIGYIIAAFTPKRQALHDILANALVIRELPRD